MALIELLDPEASPEYRDLYQSSRYDHESPYWMAMLHNVEVLRALTEYRRAILAAGPIDAELLEYVMVVVAQTNDCDYCAGSHRLKLQSIGDVDEAVIDALADGDYSTLPDLERAVVEFAEQVADDPHRVAPAHLEALYRVGFDESDIVQLLAVIANCNTSNTIVSALGITPDHRSEDLPLY